MSVDNAYRILFLGALVWFGLLLLIILEGILLPKGWLL